MGWKMRARPGRHALAQADASRAEYSARPAMPDTLPIAAVPIRAAAKPQPHPLPNPRHAARVPAQISDEALNRIRNAAYQLPQVVTAADMPSDLVPEHAPDGDDRMDRLGLVLLQKGVAGQRPSRWIAPTLFEEALRHLDALGTGPKLRPLMTERSAVLDAMSVTRAGPADWERLAIQTLTLAQDAWRIDVSHLIPVEAAPVWRFFRDGDKALLQDTLTHQPDWPHAAELQATLDGLVEQAGHINPGRIESLLPDLQSECATPQSLDPLEVHREPFLSQLGRRQAITVTRILRRQFVQAFYDSFFFGGCRLRRVALRRTRLTQDSTSPTLRNGLARANVLDRLSTPRRAQ